jgi:hypothetical protein
VADILIAVTDGLKGIGEALGAVFPATTLQTCIVHLIRNSLDYASWKDRKLLATSASIDVDRSRKVDFRRTARKPAPLLALRTSTVKLTVNFGGAASGALQINSLERSLMIEWE